MWFLSVFICTILLNNVLALANPSDIIEQGLYRQSDHVMILAKSNFQEKVYGQNHAILIQFYNSFCGHCKAFSSKYKALAKDIIHWKKAIKIAVCDCSVEENIGICRDFEILSYPSLRYFHGGYVHGKVGKQMRLTSSVDELKAQLITELQADQSANKLQHVPSLNIASYVTFESALADVPSNVKYTFLVFEDNNSTVGSELILDTLDYANVIVKRVFFRTEVAYAAGVMSAPSIVAVKPNYQFTLLHPRSTQKEELLNEINNYLSSQDYQFPQNIINNQGHNDEFDKNLTYGNVVYLSDLELTLRNSLRTEIVRYKVLNGQTLQALIAYLDTLVLNFPFKVNGLAYMQELRDTVASKGSWSGSDLYEVINNLEVKHSPVYKTDLKYIGCKGSESRFRGYTCGLWTLFHTMTVSAANLDNSGPDVLRAMYGYVKYFFGCTECSEHFQQMAARNRLFDIKENDRAVLWLWVSHNEVNLRLAGDSTEDPYFPKIQFPSLEHCASCRLVRGAWNLTASYSYLQTMYSAGNIQEQPVPMYSRASNVYSLSSFDFYMLSLLYIFSFTILILVIKLFLTKRTYRKRVYKHDGRGKV